MNGYHTINALSLYQT